MNENQTTVAPAEYPEDHDVDQVLEELAEYFMSTDESELQFLLSDASRIIRGLRTGTNYVTNGETMPTRVDFVNGRSVTIEQNEDCLFLEVSAIRAD